MPIDLSRVQPRLWSGVVWHQCAPVVDSLWYPSPANSHGRYHRVGDGGAWYASTTARGAWAELFRHWRMMEVDPFAVKRRLARVRVKALPVLDLTNGATRSLVGVDFSDLISETWITCQMLSAVVQRSHRFAAILAPGGAISGTTTLVAYAGATKQLRVESDGVRRANAAYALFLDEVRRPEHDYMRELYARMQKRAAIEEQRRPRIIL